MLTNLNNEKVSAQIFENFDVAIVGAGAAGITLTKELSSFGKNVALIEAGDYEYTDESQEIYVAKTIGDQYFDLDVARLRHFGGTTNHWVGWCRSFEEEDFKRGYLGEEYKWPITLKDIDPFKEKACNILEVPTKFEDSQLENSKIEKIDFHFSPPVRFRDKYYKELINNPKVHVFLNANLTDVQNENKRISSLQLSSYNGIKASVKANEYVFAMGGIENSRYLLWFYKKYQNNFISNDISLGRYWMEHPHFTLGQAIIDNTKVSEKYYSLTAEAQKNLKILNCGFRVIELNDTALKGLLREILCIAPTIGKSLASLAEKNLICGVMFRAAWEQAPHYENRITLDNEKDKFGIPKPILNWQKKALDRKTIMKSIEVFNQWLLEIDGGRIQLDDWLIKQQNYPTNDELAGYHHMGGTRMHENPELGVVDKNCKVYGSDNLYIAGSSVFTTGGHNNPTLPIVQIALRLANHLVNKS